MTLSFFKSVIFNHVWCLDINEQYIKKQWQDTQNSSHEVTLNDKGQEEIVLKQNPHL